MSWFNHQLSNGLNMRTWELLIFQFGSVYSCFSPKEETRNKQGKVPQIPHEKQLDLLPLCLFGTDWISQNWHLFKTKCIYKILQFLVNFHGKIFSLFPWFVQHFPFHLLCKKTMSGPRLNSVKRSFGRRKLCCGGEFSPLPCFFVSFPLNLAISPLKMLQSEFVKKHVRTSTQLGQAVGSSFPSRCG